MEKNIRRCETDWLIVDGLRVPLNTRVQVPVGKHLFIECAHYIRWDWFCQSAAAPSI